MLLVDHRIIFPAPHLPLFSLTCLMLALRFGKRIDRLKTAEQALALGIEDAFYACCCLLNGRKNSGISSG